MVKSLVTIIISICFIAVGAFLESYYVKTSFNDLITVVEQVEMKFEEEKAAKDDILALQKLWIEKKETLHVFIPHTEIKEIDLWIAECVTYAHEQKYEDAMAKMQVVKELCEQIPKSFLLRLGNVM